MDDRIIEKEPPKDERLLSKLFRSFRFQYGLQETDQIQTYYKVKSKIERWSQQFGPLVKMDQLMGKMIQNDEEKEPCARVQSESCT